MKRRPDATRRSAFGLMLLAVGRRRGFGCFGADTDAYLGSLAPLLAFALVCAGLMALRSPRAGGTLFLLWICMLLAPAVIAHPLCRRWDRADRWALYANILNWSPLLIVVLLAPMTLVAQVAVQAGAPAEPTAEAALLLLSLYSLWFQWFVARGALAVSRKRAALLLVATLLFNTLLYTILAMFGTGSAEFDISHN